MEEENGSKNAWMESINTMYNCIIDFYNCIKIIFF
jgi:hypothetical protein